MTRLIRAIRFARAYTTLLVSSSVSALLLISPAVAEPDTATVLPSATPDFVSGADDATTHAAESDTVAPPPALREDIDVAPSIEKTEHHFYCVEYARLRSGLQIFGDAGTWWEHAKNAYLEITQPVANAVMVFGRDRRIRRGHVAVVAEIVSPRIVRVDQANWQNHGEIDRYMPVLDVSAKNDWSKVRVWDTGSSHWGARVYAIKGFIARTVVAGEQASAAATSLAVAPR